MGVGDAVVAFEEGMDEAFCFAAEGGVVKVLEVGVRGWNEGGFAAVGGVVFEGDLEGGARSVSLGTRSGERGGCTSSWLFVSWSLRLLRSSSLGCGVSNEVGPDQW